MDVEKGGPFAWKIFDFLHIFEGMGGKPMKNKFISMGGGFDGLPRVNR
jgi:hypothetical protein